MEQRNGELLLERAHLPRHGRLRKSELLARMGEAARFGGGMEDLELVPIHSSSRSRSDATLPIRRRRDARNWRGEEAFCLQRRHAALPAAVTA